MFNRINPNLVQENLFLDDATYAESVKSWASTREFLENAAEFEIYNEYFREKLAMLPLVPTEKCWCCHIPYEFCDIFIIISGNKYLVSATLHQKVVLQKPLIISKSTDHEGNANFIFKFSISF